MDDSSTNNSETQTPAASSAPTKSEDKTMKKNSKLIAILACVTVLIVGAILLTLYVTVWSKPNKDDFAQAYTEAKSLESSYNAIADASKKYTEELKQTPEINSNSVVVKSYSKALTGHQAKMTAFADQKALSDQDVKKVYDTFMSQDKKYIAYTNGYIGLRKSLAVCVSIFDVVTNNNSFEAIATTHKKILQKCSPILKDLEKSSVKVFSDYGKGFNAVVTERQKTLDSIADGSLSSEAGADKIDELGKKFTTVSTNITENIVKARDDTDIVKPLRNLEAILQKKESEKE